jgi:hypothetical protein
VALALIGGYLTAAIRDRGAMYAGVAILVGGTALLVLRLVRVR